MKQTYSFDRFRNGKKMAEGAVVKASSEIEALKIVKDWYFDTDDTFTLKTKGDDRGSNDPA